ncbi:hypothetical protein CNECB9_4520002 [Cupriavidus necator]|uniref:Uncharacterized protein n=1 Tax=Cupriavidus necator TaxID=106590 RepID=A0A1K0JK35_CUPNE|nr:hypothetical protein CNECB9_4520002 [Cupriavidus necator]
MHGVSAPAPYTGDQPASGARRAMTTYAFRLLNVFAESTFGGNPLCVFDDAPADLAAEQPGPQDRLRLCL